MERDNPDMPMAKKMAIATAQAKKVAEATDDDYHKTLGPTKNSDEGIAALKKKHGMSHAKAVATLKRLMGEEVEEAVGTSAKYAGKSGMFGGKYTSKDRMMDLPLDKLNKIRDKRQAQNKAAHDKQDPKMSKMGYAKHMLDTDKADAKARKRGINPDGQYDKYKKKNNIKDSIEVDEVRKYIPPTRAEIEADKKKDRAAQRSTGISRPSASSKSLTKKVYGNMMGGLKKEEAELDEVSSSKLSDYMKASSASVSRSDARTQDKRIAGQKMADEKIRKSLGYKSTAKVAAEKNEKANVNEVLDTPQAMQSYRDKNKASKEKAASSAVAKIMRGKDKDNREHPAAELKTMAKRRSGEKLADRNAARKTFKKLRGNK